MGNVRWVLELLWLKPNQQLRSCVARGESVKKGGQAPLRSSSPVHVPPPRAPLLCTPLKVPSSLADNPRACAV